MNRIRTRCRRGSLAVIAAAETAQNTNSGPISPHPAGPDRRSSSSCRWSGNVRRATTPWAARVQHTVYKRHCQIGGAKDQQGWAHKGGRCGPG